MEPTKNFTKQELKDIMHLIPSGWLVNIMDIEEMFKKDGF